MHSRFVQQGIYTWQIQGGVWVLVDGPAAISHDFVLLSSTQAQSVHAVNVAMVGLAYVGTASASRQYADCCNNRAASDFCPLIVLLIPALCALLAAYALHQPKLVSIHDDIVSVAVAFFSHMYQQS